MVMGKKGTSFLYENWAELVAFLVLIIGFVLAISAGSAVILYIAVFFCGGLFGRYWWRFKKKLKFPAFLLILGFLIGFLLGSFYGSRKVILVLFALGLIFGYYIHEHHIIKSEEY